MTQPDDLLDHNIPVIPEPQVDSRSLSERAASGLAIQSLGTIAAKFINLAGQVAVSHYVTPIAYNSGGLALLWASYLSIFVQWGFSDFAISNAHRYRRLEPSLNFTGIVLAVVGLSLAVAAIPILLLVIPGTTAGLLLAGFFTATLVGLRSVFQAKQNLMMQFRLLTTIGLASVIAASAATVALAMAGAGPYAIVLPPLLASILSMVYLLCVAEVRVRWRGFRKAAPIYLARSFPFLAAGVLLMIWATASSMIVPYFDSAENSGRYNWAYILSQQLAVVLGSSVSTTLFASLAGVATQRQRLQQALVRSLTIFWIVAVGATIVQLAFTAPAIRLVFGVEYHPSIPLVKIFTVASAAYMTGVTLLSALKLVLSPKRYFLQLVEVTLIFLTIITLGAKLRGSWGACIAMVVWCTYFMLRTAFVALRETPGRTQILLRNLSLPLIAVAPAIAVQLALWRLVPQTRLFEWGQGMIVCTILVLTYPLMIRWLMPASYDEAKSLTLGLSQRFLGRFGRRS